MADFLGHVAYTYELKIPASVVHIASQYTKLVGIKGQMLCISEQAGVVMLLLTGGFCLRYVNVVP